MKILVLNCGSSSIKYRLFEIEIEAELLAKGLLERIGLEKSELIHHVTGKEKLKIIKPIPDHQDGIHLILETLMHPDHGVISNINEIEAVGHRVVNGGEKFKTSVQIDSEVKEGIERCIELAPLHNPANLKGILSMEAILPDVPQVATFDTSFPPDYACPGVYVSSPLRIL